MDEKVSDLASKQLTPMQSMQLFSYSESSPFGPLPTIEPTVDVSKKAGASAPSAGGSGPDEVVTSDGDSVVSFR